MAKFKHGTTVANPHARKGMNGRSEEEKRPPKYLKITAGPQRGKYVHVAIAEAILGRELEGDETVEHRDGNGLNVGFHADGKHNLIVVTKSFNSHLRHVREKRARRREASREEIPWQDQF